MTIAVTLSDTMRIEPMAMEVRAGEPTTFIVTNAGKIVHEFTLGDGTVQDEHEQEMIAMGGMGMTSDEPNAISVAPGETKELVFTFEMPGMSLAGCHVMGHYPAGMKATISVI
ncbi:MAG: plastocyanin/azurin family copper-binding protein [Chloroflexota bacterium]|nr:plastocyanin/azurin family copper-binding protein [Chloroflexota bacterium]